MALGVLQQALTSQQMLLRMQLAALSRWRL
jgi:hypothetical protein